MDTTVLRCLYALWIDNTLYAYRDQRRLDTLVVSLDSVDERATQ